VHGVGRAAPNDFASFACIASKHARQWCTFASEHHLFNARSTLVACLQGKQLDENPRAALAFWWEPLQRQVGGAGLAGQLVLRLIVAPSWRPPGALPAPLSTCCLALSAIACPYLPVCPLAPPVPSTGAHRGGGGEGARGRKRCLLQQPPPGQPGGGPCVHAVCAAAARAAGAGGQGGAAGEAVRR
jgi:hypothetical protein